MQALWLSLQCFLQAEALADPEVEANAAQLLECCSQSLARIQAGSHSKR